MEIIKSNRKRAKKLFEKQKKKQEKSKVKNQKIIQKIRYKKCPFCHSKIAYSYRDILNKGYLHINNGEKRYDLSIGCPICEYLIDFTCGQSSFTNRYHR